jgi:Glycosyl hydrolase family 63 C-terminal domain
MIMQGAAPIAGERTACSGSATGRGKNEPEFELWDTGAFDGGRYFDVFAEYAKASPDDILIRATVANRGPGAATLDVLPTLWFRNTWSWGRTGEGYWPKPRMRQAGPGSILAEHASLGRFRFSAASGPGGSAPELLFTENETNAATRFGSPDGAGFFKDAFHEHVVRGRSGAVNPERTGTKACARYRLSVPAGAEITLRFRLSPEKDAPEEPFGGEFERTFEERTREADDYYAALLPERLSEEERRIARQGYAGLLWTKQFYHYAIREWLEGDPALPAPPVIRGRGRNHDWIHLYNRDVISVPDKWEYPWYAAWDLAFHMIPFAEVDPFFAKEQLLLLLREWYMHPNGQIPAYEFAFSDANPAVHAWSAWRVYKITAPRGSRDRLFLSRVFQKLLLNFTWWVNRKDLHGNHVFAGGFLGLDNIGVFDRSKPLPTGGHLEQADGTAWMAFYCATMLSMALELAAEDPAYEDVASKFFEHFIAIADAINTLGGTGLWDEEDGIYYDHLHVGERSIPLRVRSLVGLLPLIAVEILEDEVIDRLPGFRKRMRWVLRYLLDESEFLSPYGIRSLSRIHRDRPYRFRHGEGEYRVDYVPGESDTALFGGNSNWRGPVWFPVNYLIVEALERYHRFYGETLQVECPTGSGQWMDLASVAKELYARLVRIFLPDPGGDRPCHGGLPQFAADPSFRDLILFYEYFHGDTGRGVGASHQTGWTALVIRCLGKT